MNNKSKLIPKKISLYDPIAGLPTNNTGNNKDAKTEEPKKHLKIKKVPL